MVIHRTEVRRASEARFPKSAKVLAISCTVFLSGYIGFVGRFAEGSLLYCLVFPTFFVVGGIVLLSQGLGAKAMCYLSCAIIISVFCGIWLAAFWGIQMPST